MVYGNLRLIDGAIVLIYVIGVASISCVVSRRQKNKKDYLIAGKKMHWFPVALSAVAAGFSAISMMGVPGFVMAQDMRYLPMLFTGILSIPIVFYILMPFLYKLNIISVYEYLETRFSPKLRLFSSILFICTKLAYLSMVILTPSLALAAVTGINLNLLIVIFGLITTVYTICGGLEGIIWTELVQYFFIVAGIAALVLFFLFSSAAGHVSEYWRVASDAGKTKTFDFSFGLKHMSIWVLILNSTLMGVAGMCNDQTSIQRFFAAKSVKDAMKGYLFSIIFGTPIVLALYFIGAWMFGFFNSGQILPAELAGQHDRVFPYFVAQYMPAGISGIVLAGIFAAGMSTISAVLHSLTSLSMVDFYEHFTSNSEKGRHYVTISRCVSLMWGVIAILGAFYVMKLGNSIIEVTAILGSFFAAPLGGIYFLGIFTKRANNTGAIIGGIAGIIVTAGAFLLNKYDIMEINFMWFAVFGITTTFLVGYLCSIFFEPSPKESGLQIPAVIAVPDHSPDLT